MAHPHGIILHDQLDDDWLLAKHQLNEELTQLFGLLRARADELLDSNGQLLLDAIAGDGTVATRYVANTGSNNAPTWAQVSLSSGVKDTLPTSYVQAYVPVVAQGTPANPTGTSSTAGVMMGLAQTITPLMSGVVTVILSGDISNDTAADGAKVRLRYGTGTAPANAAAAAGTAAGRLSHATKLLAGQKVPFSLNVVISGLTANTAYWFDAQLAVEVSGLTVATITDLSFSAYENR